MSRTVLQVPINPALRKKAEKVAIEEGFSSLQEAVRLFLAKYAKKKLSFGVAETVQLSPKAIKRYDKMIQRIESGKEPVYKAESVEEFMDMLNGKKDLVPKKISEKLRKKGQTQ